MSWAAVAIGVGTVASGYLASRGAKSQSRAATSAANAQLTAAREAEAGIMERFWQGREDMTPWRLAGQEGLEGLKAVTEQYQNALMYPERYKRSPGFRFLRGEGEKAMLRGASAGGGLDSGALPKDFAEFNIGLASQDYGNYLSRILAGGNQYASMAGLGQNTAVAGAQAGQNAGNQAANALLSGGRAAAGGYINQGNIAANRMSTYANLGNNALNQYMMWKGSQGGGGYQLPADIQNFNWRTA